MKCLEEIVFLMLEIRDGSYQPYSFFKKLLPKNGEGN